MIFVALKIWKCRQEAVCTLTLQRHDIWARQDTLCLLITRQNTAWVTNLLVPYANYLWNTTKVLISSFWTVWEQYDLRKIHEEYKIFLKKFENEECKWIHGISLERVYLLIFNVLFCWMYKVYIHGVTLISRL